MLSWLLLLYKHFKLSLLSSLFWSDSSKLCRSIFSTSQQGFCIYLLVNYLLWGAFKNYFLPLFLFMEIRMHVVDEVRARRRAGFCQEAVGILSL